MSVGQGSVPMDTRNHKQENEDVEVMSTDSSSSSSSDSQWIFYIFILNYVIKVLLSNKNMFFILSKNRVILGKLYLH